jgi:cysteine-rich repeat protein
MTGVTAPAGAQVQPGDLLVSVEFGDVYDIQAGGDFAAQPPFVTLPNSYASGGLCTFGNKVLVNGFAPGNGTTTVYDIASGTALPFATGLHYAVSLYCDANQQLAADTQDETVYDITSGGMAMSFATGLETYGVYRDSNGVIWATDYNGPGTGTAPFGIFDISTGGDFSGADPFAMSNAGDALSVTERSGARYAALYVAERVVDFTAGGTLENMPPFATVPNLAGVFTTPGKLWATTLTGEVYDITAGGDFTLAQAFATGLGGKVYGLVEIPPAILCGNGDVDPGETCDTSGESATCDDDCTAPVCGDDNLNEAAGEGCDDGNVASNDGCSSRCEPEGVGGTGGAQAGGAGGATASGGSGGMGGGDAGSAAAAGQGGTPLMPKPRAPEEDCHCSLPGGATSPSSLPALVLLGAAALLRRRFGGV